ncbi:hypothetical protein HOY82DRAFT_497713 [Tuber indicum]|nr:hypothetical protein HOY82DRAFT_497713 [Tuber indicum]
MRLSIITTLALALTASASPHLLPSRQITSVEEMTQVAHGNRDAGNQGQNAGNKGKVAGDYSYTVEQGVQTCGNAQLNCCNKIEKQGGATNAGLLGAVFGSGDIGIRCTPINFPAVIGVQAPINKQCDAKAACCQGEVSQNGLVNLGCVALASLI